MATDASELWSDIVPKFVRIPLLAYKHRRLVQYWTYRGLVAIGRGKSDIAVLGRSAVGKSVLTERLRGLPNDLSWTAPTLSRAVETAVVSLKKAPLILRTIPGQTSRERDDGIHEAMSSHGKLNGIIYVTDWGYTSVRDEALRQDMIASHGLEKLEDARKFNLESEIRDFEEVTARIRESVARCGRPKWLLIAVNKADLFYDKIDEAQAYYHPRLNSPFTAPLRRMIEQVGLDNIRCEAVPVCSWKEDFEWNGEKVPSRMNEGDSRILFSNLYKKIAEMSLVGEN